MELYREENLKKIEAHIEEIVKLAATCNIGGEELVEMVRFAIEDI